MSVQVARSCEVARGACLGGANRTRTGKRTGRNRQSLLFLVTELICKRRAATTGTTEFQSSRLANAALSYFSDVTVAQELLWVVLPKVMSSAGIVSQGSANTLSILLLRPWLSESENTPPARIRPIFVQPRRLDGDCEHTSLSTNAAHRFPSVDLGRHCTSDNCFANSCIRLLLWVLAFVSSLGVVWPHTGESPETHAGFPRVFKARDMGSATRGESRHTFL